MPEQGKSASVIVVVYNGRRYLRGCLGGVLEQMSPGNELIVVDNASSDGSTETIKTHFPEAKLVRNAHNRGFAAACNQGAALATGEVLVFLNQDTRVRRGWLEGLVAGFQNGAEVGLTTSKVLLMDQPERIHLCGQDVHYSGLTFGRGFLAPAGEMNTAEEVPAVAGASFAIRRELWETLGGFDETFYMYYEEMDLCWRAQSLGYRSLFVPGSIVYHDHQLQRPVGHVLYYSFRNRYLTLFKNWRWLTLLLLLPGLLLAELVDWGLALAYGWEGAQAKFKADIWLLAHTGNITGRRNPATTGYRAPDSAILTSRGHSLQPKMVTGGAAGRIVVKFINALFALHYRLVRWTLQTLGR